MHNVKAGSIVDGLILFVRWTSRELTHRRLC
jgi:hypothetical protein